MGKLQNNLKKRLWRMVTITVIIAAGCSLLILARAFYIHLNDTEEKRELAIVAVLDRFDCARCLWILGKEPGDSLLSKLSGTCDVNSVNEFCHEHMPSMEVTGIESLFFESGYKVFVSHSSPHILEFWDFELYELDGGTGYRIAEKNNSHFHFGSDEEEITPSVLPVECPTTEEMANDPTFGKYRSPSCSARRSTPLIELLEPSLEVGVPNDVIAFRLYVSHTYAPDQLVRLQKVGGKIELIEKVAVLRNPNSPYTIWKEPEVESVSPEAWTKWKRRFDDSTFWDIERIDLKEMAANADGSSWTLEVSHNGRFWSVTRDDNTALLSFIELCEELLNLAGNP